MRSFRSVVSLVALASIVTTTVTATGCKGEDPAGSTGDPTGDVSPSTPGTPAQPSPIPDEGPLPSLRTGALVPEQLEAVTVELKARGQTKHDPGAHYYTFELEGVTDHELARVQMSGAAVAAVEGDGRTVLVRAAATSEPADELRGTALFASNGFGAGRAWQALPFTAKGLAPSNADDESLASRWTSAFASEMRGDSRRWFMIGPSHPWREFAAGRVQALAGEELDPNLGVGPDARPRRTDLSELMHTTTAATSMQEALQHDRGLRLGLEAGPATIPLVELAPPELAAHPFAQMLAALPNPSAATPEPLAKAAPSEFWYVRFDDIRVLLRVLDEADTWFTPVAQLMEERAEVHDLSKRYQAQLGLRRTGLAKALGHTVIDRVAVMGSDPYLREGSDVTMVFALSNQTVFESELARHMDSYEAEVPGIVESTINHGEHVISVHRDPTGTVRQHRAFVAREKLALVSNSEVAIKAVLDAIDGKRRRLADDEDLAYMLARDPGEHDGFAFLGDHFIAEVIGPRQKVLAARRQQALAELLTPGYAALLYGWLEGAAPADTEALIASGLLDRGELVHADGSAIAFVPGGPARSSWGSARALVPLIDLPTPTLVSEAERDAYANFTRGYQEYWRQFIDPVAIRLDIEDGTGDTATATLDVRVLPLIEGTDYADIEAIVGTERIEVPAINDGLQMVWAVGGESELRRELDRSASALTGKADIGIGWLGDWVMVGTLDRRALLDSMIVLDEGEIQLPAPKRPDAGHDEEDLEIARTLGKLPVYAAAHVRNPVALVATLAAIKVAINEVAPGMIVWGEHARYREFPIVRIGLSPTANEFSEYASAIALYYVQANDVFVLALDPKVLESLVDRVVDGGGPKRGVDGGPQFAMEARVAKGLAGWTAVAWALQGQANRSQTDARTAAEILLRGDPSVQGADQLVARGLDYFGSYPVSASGQPDFSFGPYGVGDPIHGSEAAPAFPSLPVLGSPIAALMDRMTALRATVAFDREPAKLTPPARSLHTRVELQLGPLAD